MATPAPLPVPPTADAPAPAAIGRETAPVRAPEAAQLATHAAERMPAGRMNVRVELPDIGPVEVRVALRQGQVHTAFRTDSPEVRAALAAGWDNFAVARETPSHRPLAPADLTGTSVPGSSLTAGFFQTPTGSGQGQPAPEQPPAAAPRFFPNPAAEEDDDSTPLATLLPHDFSAPAKIHRLRAVA